LITGLSLTVAGLLGAWAIQKDRGPDEIVDSILSGYSGDIEVTFHVRDTDGNPLDGVNVRLTESRLASTLGENHEPNRIVVEPDFTVEKKGISALHLRFTREGFYSERWGFVMSERPQEFLGKLFVLEVEIFMTPHPVPAPLVKYEGSLQSSVNGFVSVLSIAGKQTSSSQTEKPGEGSTFTTEPRVGLIAGMAADGQLARTLFKMKRFSVPKPVLDRGILELSGGDEGDGFLLADIGDEPAVFERGFRKMSSAPNDGYEAKIDLIPIRGKEKAYFYCRVEGSYGKGVLTNPPLIIEKDGREIAISNVIVYLNPTGSTDVSYLHH
jgi:hypothetical protein